MKSYISVRILWRTVLAMEINKYVFLKVTVREEVGIEGPEGICETDTHTIKGVGTQDLFLPRIPIK